MGGLLLLCSEVQHSFAVEYIHLFFGVGKTSTADENAGSPKTILWDEIRLTGDYKRRSHARLSNLLGGGRVWMQCGIIRCWTSCLSIRIHPAGHVPLERRTRRVVTPEMCSMLYAARCESTMVTCGHHFPDTPPIAWALYGGTVHPDIWIHQLFRALVALVLKTCDLCRRHRHRQTLLVSAHAYQTA